uniref:Uncharacterized protein LOC111110166 n=1 Tax=Crassostrea virginica TaxID=6565 RepID=A0A8B8BHH3_CRAVI|nr:uncharacterized protein LOC111110166 [Crassostrea virginica]
MKRTIKLVILYELSCICLYPVFSMRHLQQDACSTDLRTATFRIRVIAPAIVTTSLRITPAGAPPQGLPFMIPIRPPVMDPPHHIRRRKKRLSFRPTTPPFPPAFLPDEWGSCYVGGEYKATIVTAYNIRFYEHFGLRENTMIEVYGSALLTPGADLLVTAVMRYSCGTWKVTSVRNWSELSQYQIELLNERVYFSHCKDLDQCFGDIQPERFECYDKFSYCDSGEVKKAGKEFGSCVRELKGKRPKAEEPNQG